MSRDRCLAESLKTSENWSTIAWDNYIFTLVDQYPFSQKFVRIILTFSLTINPTTIPKSFSQRLSYDKF